MNKTETRLSCLSISDSMLEGLSFVVTHWLLAMLLNYLLLQHYGPQPGEWCHAHIFVRSQLNKLASRSRVLNKSVSRLTTI